MLTVKVIGPSEDETIFEATQVRKTPIYAGETVSENAVGHIFCDTEDGQISYGIDKEAMVSDNRCTRIYVMNRQGSTIATYYV